MTLVAGDRVVVTIGALKVPGRVQNATHVSGRRWVLLDSAVPVADVPPQFVLSGSLNIAVLASDCEVMR